jgi:hypothetical protein
VATERSNEYLDGLVRELCKLSRETEWVELKVNNTEPEEIGEYLSALANSAALCGKAFAYIVWRSNVLSATPSSSKARSSFGSAPTRSGSRTSRRKLRPDSVRAGSEDTPAGRSERHCRGA